MTLDIDDYQVRSWKVSKRIGDRFQVLKAEISKHDVPATFEKIKATALDHNSIRQTPFVGIIPAVDLKLATAADKATVTAYDYGWYLTVQHVPEDLLTIDIDQNPSETIVALLGGTAWTYKTGIEPYRINDVTAWDDPTTPIKKSFTFQEQTTKHNAIAEICDYCNFVFVVKWREVDGDWQPCAYFVHEDDIDTAGIGLDLPASITITDPDDYLLSDVTVNEAELYKYNRVIAFGYDHEEGIHWVKVAETPAVAAHTEIPNEYMYSDVTLNTAEKTEAKAQELLDLFQESSTSYRAKFKHRMDLELYQRISFVGYQKIDPGETRITKITYSRKAANDTVTIEFSKNQAIRQLERMARIMRTRIYHETVHYMPDMWEVVSGYAQLRDTKPINMQRWWIDNTSGVRGPLGSNFSLWGGDDNDHIDNLVDFMRWHNHVSYKAEPNYLEIKRALYINNDPAEDQHYSKIYFDIDNNDPTLIIGHRYSTFSSIEFKVRGDTLLDLKNPTATIENPAHAMFPCNIKVSGRIEGTGEDLVFYDSNAGEHTLTSLLSGSLWRMDWEADTVGLVTPKPVDLQGEYILNLEGITAELNNGIRIKEADGVTTSLILANNITSPYSMIAYKPVDMLDNKITNLAAATVAGDALRYEQLIGMYLPLAGGVMNGEAGIDMNAGSLTNVGWLSMYSGSDINMNGGQIKNITAGIDINGADGWGKGVNIGTIGTPDILRIYTIGAGAVALDANLSMIYHGIAYVGYINMDSSGDAAIRYVKKITFTPIAAPTWANEGDLYYDQAAKKLKVFTGSIFETIQSS